MIYLYHIDIINIYIYNQYIRTVHILLFNVLIYVLKHEDVTHLVKKQSIRPWHENECFFSEKNVTGTPPILWQKDLQKRFE